MNLGRHWVRMTKRTDRPKEKRQQLLTTSIELINMYFCFRFAFVRS